MKIHNIDVKIFNLRKSFARYNRKLKYSTDFQQTVYFQHSEIEKIETKKRCFLPQESTVEVYMQMRNNPSFRIINMQHLSS